MVEEEGLLKKVPGEIVERTGGGEMNQVTGGIWVQSASSEKKGKCGWPDGAETAFHAAGKEIEISDTLASSKATPTNDERRTEKSYSAILAGWKWWSATVHEVTLDPGGF